MITREVDGWERFFSVPVFLLWQAFFMLAVLVVGLCACFALMTPAGRSNRYAMDVIKEGAAKVWDAYSTISKLFLSGRFKEAGEFIDNLEVDK